MEPCNRRTLIQMAAGALAGARGLAANAPARKIRLGVVTSLRNNDAKETLNRVRGLGLPTCQLSAGSPSLKLAGSIRAAAEKNNVEITALLDLGPGRHVWDFYDGPKTIGLVPPETRRARIDSLKRTADLAAECGIEAVQTHYGFIPENPNDPLYEQLVAAIREVASYCKQRRLMVLCETGQETPITLLRTIQDVGLDNLRVNLDTANLILYGKGNPVDALDVIGKYVGGIHAKDGLFPTDPRRLGQEVPIGRGKADFPRIIERLHELNYNGAITIEREIEGAQQTADILASKTYLEGLIRRFYGSEA